MPDGIVVAPGATFYPTASYPTSGLAGTLGVRILKDSDGSTALARQTTGITETPAGSGVYVATLVAPTTAGEYTIVWDDGSVTPGHTASEDLLVTSSVASGGAPSGTDLCTVADVKVQLEGTSGASDTTIQTLITQVSEDAPLRYQREFAPQGTLTRTFRVDRFLVDLAPYDLRSATTVTLDPNGSPAVLTSSQYQLRPIGGGENLGTYTELMLANTVTLASTRAIQFGSAELQIVGIWGPAAVPADIVRAAALTVASYLSRPINAANALETFNGGDGAVRPDRFGGFAYPMGAHQTFSRYARIGFA